MQRDEKGKRHLVAYFSSTLNKAEWNYNIYTLELCAIIRALMLQLDFTLLCRHVGLPRLLFPFPSLHRSPCTIRSGLVPMYNTNLVLFPCTIRSGCVLVYNINLGATHTTILSIRGVTIPIYLVSSTTDSIRRRIVLFKPVPVLTSDPKSEFLCQSSLSCAEPTDPLNTSYAWDISHALVITYHPYCHSPGALTEYLKQKLHHQRAKRLGCSLPAQVEQNVPL